MADMWNVDTAAGEALIAQMNKIPESVENLGGLFKKMGADAMAFDRTLLLNKQVNTHLGILADIQTEKAEALKTIVANCKAIVDAAIQFEEAAKANALLN